ncbi:MAG: hypothetical protein LBJ76_02955 [Candidatus Accumulibacter sp.]|jgi:hypothetical protein|nr:hypothetical protein [Accumulibacter sp.]
MGESNLKKRYLAAVVLAEFDSPIDALISLHVPTDEARDVVNASWRADPADCFVCSIDGGRGVAAIRTPEGRWAACHVFSGSPCATRAEAERRLKKPVRRGRRGIVGVL